MERVLGKLNDLFKIPWSLSSGSKAHRQSWLQVQFCLHCFGGKLPQAEDHPSLSYPGFHSGALNARKVSCAMSPPDTTKTVDRSPNSYCSPLKDKDKPGSGVLTDNRDVRILLYLIWLTIHTWIHKHVVLCPFHTCFSSWGHHISLQLHLLQIHFDRFGLHTYLLPSSPVNLLDSCSLFPRLLWSFHLSAGWTLSVTGSTSRVLGARTSHSAYDAARGSKLPSSSLGWTVHASFCYLDEI